MRPVSPRRFRFGNTPLIALLVLSAPARAELSGNSVGAQGCASAIGGNVSATTILVACGIPPEKLEELVKDRTRLLEEGNASLREFNQQLQKDLRVNENQRAEALRILGEANVPPERLAAKLVEIAERFKDLQTTAAAQPGDDSQITALKAEAQRRLRTASSARPTKFWPRSKKFKPRRWTGWRSTPRKPRPSAVMWP